MSTGLAYKSSGTATERTNTSTTPVTERATNYLSIGGKSVIKNDESKLNLWDVIIYDMEVPGKPFKE